MTDRSDPTELENFSIPLPQNPAALFFDIATQTLGGFSPENGAPFRRETGGETALKPAEKTVAMNHPQRYNATNQRDEKTLPARTGQGTPGLAGSLRLTTCLTTDSSGARGNSGFKRFKEYEKTNGKMRKCLKTHRKNLVQPFGSKMPSIRIAPLGPDVLWDPGFQRESSFRMEGTGPDAAAARILAVFPGRCIIKNSGDVPQPADGSALQKGAIYDGARTPSAAAISLL